MSLDEKQNLLFNMRETWAVGSKATETKKDGTKVTTENEDLERIYSRKYNIFTKLTKTADFYAKAGKSVQNAKFNTDIWNLLIFCACNRS